MTADWITPNGPAVWGGCVTRRNSGRIPNLVLWQRISFGRKRSVWRGFCLHGTNFIECWRDRGTSLIGAANLSPITKLEKGTYAVSRYKLSRRQKTVKGFEILIACRCAFCPTYPPAGGEVGCPGARTFNNLSWVQEQKLRSHALRDKLRDEIPPWRGKNCDELINYTVRIIRRYVVKVFLLCNILIWTEMNLFYKGRFL